MDSLWTFALTVFTGFFAIMNPIACTPMFMSLVDGYDNAEKKRIAKQGCLTAFGIVTVFAILGNYIFALFEITIPAFKITGGILIFFVGLEMLMSKKSSIKHPGEVSQNENLAISPLAIPILAGPGTIVTAMNFVTNADYLRIAIVILIFGVMVWLTYIFFSLSDYIVRKLGNNIIAVIGKLMGLILAIIGTGMFIRGIKLAFDIAE